MNYRSKSMFVTKTALILLSCTALIRCATRRYTAFNDFGTPQISNLFEAPTRITIGNESSYGASLSPNGAYMFYTSDKSGNKDIYVKKTRGGFPQQLTSHPADDFFPVMSPNGKRIAFVSRRINASGAIHIMEVGQTISKLTGNIEGEVVDINLRDAENRNPAWFPKGDKIVFSARIPGEPIPMLCIGTTDDDPTITSLEKIRGDYPTVSHDGTKLAYSRYGSIYMYDLISQQESKLTEGNIVQDGHPRFSDNDEEIIFIRYADDTNTDGSTNALDRPTVWKLNISYQLNHQNILENFAITPLTSANYSAFYPSTHNPYLYFSTQDQDSLDIYRLPNAGHTVMPKGIESVIESFENLSDDFEKTYVLRNSSSVFFKESNFTVASKLAIEELEWLYEQGKFLEGNLLAKKIEKNFANYPEVLASTKLAVIHGKIAPYRYPDGDMDLDPIKRGELFEWLSEIKNILSNIENVSPGSKQISLIAKYIEAEIQATLGEVKNSMVALDAILKSINADSSVASKALYYRSKLEFAEETPDKAVQSILEMEQKFPSEKTRIISGALDVTTSVTLSDDKAIEKLNELKKTASNSPMLLAYAHRRLAAVYRQQKKNEAANDELRSLIKAGIGPTSLVLDAANQLVAEEESQLRFASVAGIFTSLLENYSDNNEIMEQVRQIQSDFYVRRGRSNLANGDYGYAIKEFEDALKINSKNVAAKQGIVDAKALRNDLGSSINEYRAQSLANGNDSDSLYLLAYALNKTPAESESERAKVIDESILLLESARNLNGQVAQYHGLLGRLYLEKAKFRKKQEQSDTFKSKISRSLNHFKSFFGFSESNWFEFSIDSNLSAINLAGSNTVEYADLAQLLGDTYFENQNYQLSLRFYTKRIQMIQSIPVGSTREEMLLFRHAGRAAFFAQELDVAFVYQAKAYQLAKELNREIDIAYSLDVLALTLREQKKYIESKDVLIQLLNVNASMNDKNNQANTRVNLGYTFYMSDKYKLALDQYSKAKELLAQLGEEEKDGKKSIKIDLGGQNSASQGFSKLEKLIQISAFRSQVYLADDNYDEALNELKEKIRLLEIKHQNGKKLGFAASYLAEEFAIAHNNAGFIYCKNKNLNECISSFKLALDYAKRLRIKDQKHPARPEWLNLLDLSRAYLQKADINQISEKEKSDILKLIDEALKEFEEPMKAENRESMLAAAALKSVSAQLMSINSKPDSQIYLEAQKRFQDSIILSEKLGIKSVFSNTANLNLDRNLSDKKEDREEIFAAQINFRKSALVSPNLAWKYLASRGMCKQALTRASAYVSTGGSLLESDRGLLRKCVESELNGLPFKSEKADERLDEIERQNLAAKISDGFDALRIYSYIYAHSILPVQQSEKFGEIKSDATIKEIFPLGRTERIAASLEKQDGFAAIFQHSNGDVSLFLSTPGNLGYFKLNNDDKSHETSLRGFSFDKAFKDLNPLENLERVYIFTDQLDFATKWQSLNSFRNKVPTSFLPAPDLLPKLIAEKNLGTPPEIIPPEQSSQFAWNGYLDYLQKNATKPFVISKLKVDSAFVDAAAILHEEYPLIAIYSLDKEAILCGYFGPSKHEFEQRGKIIQDRALKNSEESFKLANFEKSLQYSKEYYIASHQINDPKGLFNAAMLVIDSMLKSKSISGLGFYKEQIKKLSNSQNKKRSLEGEIDAVNVAITRGDLASADKILNEITTESTRLKDKILLGKYYLARGSSALASQDYKNAIEHLSNAKDSFLQAKNLPLAADANLQTAEIHSKYLGNYSQALKLSSEAADLASRAQNRQLFIKSRRTQIDNLSYLNNFKEGIKLCEEIFTEARQILSINELVELHILLGRIQLKAKLYTNLNETIAKARNLLRDVKNKDNIESLNIQLLTLSAESFASQGKRADASKLFNSATLDSINAKPSGYIRDLHHQFAIWLSQWGDYGQAVNMFKKSITLTKEMPQSTLTASYLIQEHANLAFAFLKLDQIDRAKEELSESDKIKSQYVRSKDFYAVELIRADIHLVEKNLQLAEKTLTNLIGNETESNQQEHLWKSYFGLALISHSLGQKTEAGKYIKKAIEVQNILNEPYIQKIRNDYSISNATSMDLFSLAIQIFIESKQLLQAFELSSKIKFESFKSAHFRSYSNYPLATLVDLQKQLAADSKYIDFFWGTDGLGVFIIDKYSISAKFTKIDSSTRAQLKEQLKSAFATPLKANEEVLNLILGDIESQITAAKTLIISPDGPLLDFSFSGGLALRNSGVALPTISYLPYPIKQVNSEANQAYIAINKATSMIALIIPDHPLHFSYKEKSVVPRFFPNSSVLEESQITFDTWKESAINKQLVHLSLAPTINANSETVLEFPSIKGHKQKISLDEISKLKLNAQISVLSHSNTPVNLANAFLAANSNNVLVNIGSTDDVTSTFIIKNFYRSIQSGKTPCDALHFAQTKAKKYFSKNLNWSNYIIYGGCAY